MPGHPGNGTATLAAAGMRGEPEVLRRALRATRETLNLSQESWASILGVSMTTVARWETDNPKRATIAPPMAIHLYRELFRRPELRAQLAQRPDVVALAVAASLLPVEMLGQVV